MRLDKLSSSSHHPFVDTLIARLEKHVAKRRSVVSRLAMFVRLQEQNTFLDRRLKEANDLGSINDELIKFFIDARRTAESTDGACAPDADDDPDVSFESFSRTFLRFRQRRTASQNVQRADVERAALLLKLAEGADDQTWATTRFPTKMLAILNTLPPTSAAEERTFSSAKHQRTCLQQRLDDDRHARKLAPRRFYIHNKPWDALMTQHSLKQNAVSSTRKNTQPRTQMESSISSTRLVSPR